VIRRAHLLGFNVFFLFTELGRPIRTRKVHGVYARGTVGDGKTTRSECVRVHEGIETVGMIMDAKQCNKIYNYVFIICVHVEDEERIT
jgi:hypothetical protein